MKKKPIDIDEAWTIYIQALDWIKTNPGFWDQSLWGNYGFFGYYQCFGGWILTMAQIRFLDDSDDLYPRRNPESLLGNLLQINDDQVAWLVHPFRTIQDFEDFYNDRQHLILNPITTNNE